MIDIIRKKVFKVIINDFASSNLVPMSLRNSIYRFFKMDIGDCKIFSNQFFTSNRVRIGDGTFINHKCFFENSYSYVNIGRNCDIGMNVIFCGVTHQIGSKYKRAGQHIGKDINVGAGTWIGANVTILPGVNIGPGCVIAAGSIVTRDCNSNSLYMGAPAKLKKKLDEV